MGQDTQKNRAVNEKIVSHRHHSRLQRSTTNDVTDRWSPQHVRKSHWQGRPGQVLQLDPPSPPASLSTLTSLHIRPRLATRTHTLRLYLLHHRRHHDHTHFLCPRGRTRTGDPLIPMHRLLPTTLLRLHTRVTLRERTARSMVSYIRLRLACIKPGHMSSA